MKDGTIVKSKHHNEFNNEVELVQRQLLNFQDDRMKRKKEKNTSNTMFGSLEKPKKTN